MLDPEKQFSIFRCDRNTNTNSHREGGGVCAFVSRDFKSVPIDFSARCKQLFDLTCCEVMCFEIHFISTVYRFILVYRPPNSCYCNSEKLKSSLKSLTSLLTELTHCRHTTFIAGDFNLPKINWSNNNADFDGLHDVFLNCMSSLGMAQLVTEPSRYDSFNRNILDLVFTNDPLAVDITNMLPPFSTSDHTQIEFSISLPASTQNSTPVGTPSNDSEHTSFYLSVYDWSAADYSATNEQLTNINWHELFGYNFDVNSIWNKFKTILWPIIDLFVPKKHCSHRQKYRTRTYPKFIINLLQRKAAIWRVFKKSPNSTTKSKYTNIANKCKLAILKFDTDREIKMLESNNLGAFYRFVNNKTTSSSGVAPLRNPDGTIITSDIDKANLLNNYFQSVFMPDNGILPVFKTRLSTDLIHFHDITISPSIILAILNKLKINSAAGPDRLPPILFHRASSSLSLIHYQLFSVLLSILRTFHPNGKCQ